MGQAAGIWAYQSLYIVACCVPLSFWFTASPDRDHTTVDPPQKWFATKRNPEQFKLPGCWRLLPRLECGVLVGGLGAHRSGRGLLYEEITFKLALRFIAGERGTCASSGIDKNLVHRART